MTSAARCLTRQNQTLTYKSPMRTRRRFVSKSCIGSSIPLRVFGTDWVLCLVDHFLRRKVLLTISRPAPVSGSHMCGFNWLELIPNWTCTLYVGFEKSATVVDVSCKGHFSADITDEGRPRRFSGAVFSRSAVSVVSVVSLLDFWVPVRVVLAKPLFRRGLLYEAPTCRAKSLSS